MSRKEVIDYLTAFAKSFIGTYEVGGDNRGPMVERFQKAVDGVAQRESWCMSYCQFCLKETERVFMRSSGIFPSEHCLTVWNKTPIEHRYKSPQPGDIVIWQYFINGRPTASGHTGIVLSVNGARMTTVEGNTGPGDEVVREGDGVFKKSRSLKGSQKMRVIGFLRPFLEA